MMCAGSARSVWATLGLPPLTACVLFLSTLPRLQVALQGNCLKWALGCMHFPGLRCSGSGSRVLHKVTDLVASAFCALSRSEQLRRPGVWRVHTPQVGGASYHLPSPSRLVSWMRSRAPSLVCHVSPLGGWSLAVTLLVGVNRPVSQEDLVSNWEPACSLVEDAIFGAMSLAFQLWLSPAFLPASSGGWAGLLPASFPLVFAQPFFL